MILQQYSYGFMIWVALERVWYLPTFPTEQWFWHSHFKARPQACLRMRASPEPWASQHLLKQAKGHLPLPASRALCGGHGGRRSKQGAQYVLLVVNADPQSIGKTRLAPPPVLKRKIKLSMELGLPMYTSSMIRIV